ncbi:unnamed protein product [Orchesella dallaii]|uniref:Odorant receptor n=1 Tax=Orchesella dallaii TaxID=48710 RepID=A0ABP1RBC3_9HEXA
MQQKPGLFWALNEFIKQDNWFHIIPIKSQGENGKYVVAAHSFESYRRYIASFFCCLVGVVLLLSIFLSSQSKALPEKSQTILTASVYFMVGSMCWNLYNTNAEVVSLLNGFILVDTELKMGGKQQPEDGKRKLAHFICRMFIITIKCLPVFLAILSGIVPSFPTNAFEFLNSCEIWENSAVKYIYRVALMIGNYFAWHLVATLGFFFALKFLVTFESARVYQLSLLNFSVKEWKVLQRVYRKIQLLLQLFNKLHAGGFVVYLLLVVGLGQITCTYICIRYSGIPLPVVIMLLFEVTDCYLIILGVYGFAGDVNTTSIIVLQTLQCKLMGEKKIVRKELKSLSVLKMKFGTANYIDKMTPLVFINFNHGRILDLLLVGA